MSALQRSVRASRRALHLLLFLGVAVACSPAPEGAAGGSSSPAPPGRLEVVWGAERGERVDPMPRAGDPATLWVFIGVDCPVANGYAPELRAIGARCGELGARMLLVHVDPTVDAAAAAAHGLEYGLEASVVLDPDHRLVRHVGATVTPEAAVFDGDGALRYLGRIDDRYPALGSRRAEAGSTELRDALEAVAGAGGVVPEARPAVGCLIEELAR
ncbi:MAG: redoxin domain-containing protein [Planctomycetota bacterium]